MAYWLMKSEPNTFSIDDLANRPNQIEGWDGVRNYQARNFIKQMQIDDLAFFYHSNTKIPAIVGMMKIVKTAYPDPTQFCPDSHYFDPKSTIDRPRWYLVDVQFIVKFAKVISLNALKNLPEIADFALVKKGNRLSVMPVEKNIWDRILLLQSNN